MRAHKRSMWWGVNGWEPFLKRCQTSLIMRHWYLIQLLHNVSMWRIIQFTISSEGIPMDFRVLGLKASEKWRCTASLHSLDTKKQAPTMPCLLFVYKSCWTLPSSRIYTMKAPISMDGWMDGFAYKKIQGCMDLIFSLKPFVNCRTTILWRLKRVHQSDREAMKTGLAERDSKNINLRPEYSCPFRTTDRIYQDSLFSHGKVDWVVVMSIRWLEHITSVFKL